MRNPVVVPPLQVGIPMKTDIHGAQHHIRKQKTAIANDPFPEVLASIRANPMGMTAIVPAQGKAHTGRATVKDLFPAFPTRIQIEILPASPTMRAKAAAILHPAYGANPGILMMAPLELQVRPGAAMRHPRALQWALSVSTMAPCAVQRRPDAHMIHLRALPERPGVRITRPHAAQHRPAAATKAGTLHQTEAVPNPGALQPSTIAQFRMQPGTQPCAAQRMSDVVPRHPAS